MEIPRQSSVLSTRLLIKDPRKRSLNQMTSFLAESRPQTRSLGFHSRFSHIPAILINSIVPAKNGKTPPTRSLGDPLRFIYAKRRVFINTTRIIVGRNYRRRVERTAKNFEPWRDIDTRCFFDAGIELEGCSSYDQLFTVRPTRFTSPGVSRANDGS